MGWCSHETLCCHLSALDPAGARVLVVSSPAVHAELLALAQRGGLPQQLLDQVGAVCGLIKLNSPSCRVLPI